MPVMLFFNELSVTLTASPQQIDKTMAEFVDLVRTIHRWRRDAALVTAVPLKSLELAPGYSIQQWIAADGANRDRWRLIRAVQNRAPYRSLIPDDADSDVEYRHDDNRAEGIGTAHLLGGLAISLPSETKWDSPWVTADRTMLAEDEYGSVSLHEDTVEVRHAATRSHIELHKNWVQETGRDGLGSGVAIWENRSLHFPHLTFLPRVEDDLRSLRQDWVRSVSGLLLRVQDAVAEWNEGNAALPSWRTKVSQEFEGRERLCQFVDLDGVSRVFEWHARFTPGAGRLHFRLVAEDRTARVAYIGLKLGL
ncbi:hypothetical protein ACQP1K_05060 [Sphaerimonospora sp. CA-214678]|uniref:hypothetical protein n=1 Tax=Sphaerimonospora sp. CA-214678 TaxID=3240029 RepID=UPI003D8A41F4